MTQRGRREELSGSGVADAASLAITAKLLGDGGAEFAANFFFAFVLDITSPPSSLPIDQGAGQPERAELHGNVEGDTLLALSSSQGLSGFLLSIHYSHTPFLPSARLNVEVRRGIDAKPQGRRSVSRPPEFGGRVKVRAYLRPKIRRNRPVAPMDLL